MRTFSTSFCPFHFSFALSCFTVPLSFFPISNVATLHGRFNKEINSTQKPNNWIIWCGSNLRINFYVRCDVFISKKTTHFSSFAHQTMPADTHTHAEHHRLACTLHKHIAHHSGASIRKSALQFPQITCKARMFKLVWTSGRASYSLPHFALLFDACWNYLLHSTRIDSAACFFLLLISCC